MARRLILGLFAGTAVLLFGGAGCTKQDPADSSIPWGRPATWEDRVPGMSDY